MDQFERLKILVGNEKFKKINNLTVLIIGLGGVGSYAVEALVRSGIKKIILIDSDKIDITNLNRQLMTNYNNIGNYKTDSIKERISSINKFIEVKCINEYITKDNIELLFNDKVDYIIDACDSINTKKEIIRQCTKRKIKFISSMGVGNKMEPSRLRITDVRKTNYDPISKIIRKMVRDEKIRQKIPVVFSDEIPIKTNKIIGSNSFVPATAGLLCASYVINDFIKE